MLFAPASLTSSLSLICRPPSAGYGDVVPVTMMERWFDVVAMLLGGLIFGYIIGAIGNLVQQTSAKENEYHMAMNELDFFMNEMKLPLLMRTEISNYFQRLHTR